MEQSGTPVGEFAGILLAATLGAMFLCGATDLVTIFVSLETLSVSSYLLAGYMKRDARSSEAALKYLLVGSAAAAVFRAQDDHWVLAVHDDVAGANFLCDFHDAIR